MYVYQIYPNPETPIALLRAKDGLWESAEVYAHGSWRSSARASLIFSLHTYDDGEYITEKEALRLQNTPNIDSDVDRWVTPQEGEEEDGQDAEG